MVRKPHAACGAFWMACQRLQGFGGFKISSQKKKKNFSWFQRQILSHKVIFNENDWNTFNKKLPWLFLVVWPTRWEAIPYPVHLSKKGAYAWIKSWNKMFSVPSISVFFFFLIPIFFFFILINCWTVKLNFLKSRFEGDLDSLLLPQELVMSCSHT